MNKRKKKKRIKTKKDDMIPVIKELKSKLKKTEKE